MRFRVHELTDGWDTETNSLSDALAVRDELLSDPEMGYEVQITVIVDDELIAALAAMS